MGPEGEVVPAQVRLQVRVQGRARAAGLLQLLDLTAGFLTEAPRTSSKNTWARRTVTLAAGTEPPDVARVRKGLGLT